MAKSSSVIKTLIVPAITSLLIFLGLTYALLPLWRRYRSRYAQYVPLHLESLSSQTASWRHRFTSWLARRAMPSTWRRERELESMFAEADGASDQELDDGEELDEVVDQEVWRRLERHAQQDRPGNERRLSRDLEEGFRDSSDETSDS